MSAYGFKVNKKVQAQSSLIITQQLVRLESQCCRALKNKNGWNCIRYTQIRDLIVSGNHKRFLGCFKSNDLRDRIL